MLKRTLAFILLLAPCCIADPVNYILDTDIASDCDDAGAVAAVNALASNGEVKILAMMVSTGGKYGAPAVCAINTWYGRGDVPIGTVKDPTFWVGGSPDEPSGWKNYESYNRWLAENCPTKLKSGDDAPDAKVLYRQILAKQPDNSVVINTIGPLINLAHLLETKPDDASPLAGPELIKAKVKLLVVTGGRNPKGTSSNFSKENAEDFTKPVIETWPTPVVFVGNEIALELKVGWQKNREGTEGNPARLAYKQFFKGAEKPRACADQAGVLYAVRGLGDFFKLHDTGHQTCDDKGTTTWSEEALPSLKHAYLVKNEGVDEKITSAIESLMTQSRAMTIAK